MYTVALFKNSNGEYAVFHSRDNKELEVIENILKVEISDHLDYKLESCLITTEKTLALKTRLHFKLIELRSLKEETDYYGYDEVLMRQIGLLVSRLMRLGVDVTDEVALQCYDFRYKV